MAREPRLAPEFPILDTLRVVGAIAVLTTHTTYQAGVYGRHGLWGTLAARLDVGVAIFFVLSGFLLSRPYFARHQVGLPHPGTGRYYWKRWLRIYPVYLITAVVALSLIPENDGASASTWRHTLTMTNIYTENRLPQGLTQMWSLAVEVSYYVLLPLIMLVMLGRRRLSTWRVVAILVAFTAFSCWWLLDLVGQVSPSSPGQPNLWLPSYLTWFVVGMALALAHVLYESRERPALPVRLLIGLGSVPGVCWTLAVGLLLISANSLAGATTFAGYTSVQQSLTKHLLYAAIGGVLVLTGVFADDAGRYARFMSRPGLRHLGHISYGIFCIHLPILSLVLAVTNYQVFGGHGWQIWGLTLVLTLIASELLYRFVEVPAMRLKNVGRGNRTRKDPSDQPSTNETAATTRY